MTRAIYALALCSAACGRLGFDPDTSTRPVTDAPADACPLGAWGPPSKDAFANVNAESVTDWGVQITPDGLHVFFQSRRTVGSDSTVRYKILVADRTQRDQPFGAPRYLSALNEAQRNARDPSPTPDLTELFFVDDNETMTCLYVAKYDNARDDWGVAAKVNEDALCRSGNDGMRGVWISDDGLRLYYDTEATDGDARQYLRVAQRARRSDTFEAGKAFERLPDGMRYCSLASDELTAYCEREVVGGIQVWQATRASLNDEFTNPTQIPETIIKDALGMPLNIEGDPSITRDGATMVYAAGDDKATPDEDADLVLIERGCR